MTAPRPRARCRPFPRDRLRHCRRRPGAAPRPSCRPGPWLLRDRAAAASAPPPPQQVFGGREPSPGESSQRDLSTYSGFIEVLFLCTGNICRSPMAEAFLRHRLEGRRVDVNVGSAGLRLVGEPASANGVDVLSARGLDLSAHRSRILDPELLEGTDLALAMAREHLREAVLARPDIWPRAFTLKELVRRGEMIGPRAP